MNNVLGDNIGFIRLTDQMQNEAAIKTVNSARISYDKNKDFLDDKDHKLLKFLWKNGHTSPYRHSFYTFHIKAPLFVFRQWIKHQVGCAWRSFEVNGQETSEDVFLELNDLLFDTDSGTSWNEISGRYVKLKPEFYIPSEFRTQSTENKQQSEAFEADSTELTRIFKRQYKTAYKNYEKSLELGIAREQARSLLPQGVYTECYWTCSLQALLHFLNERAFNVTAQWEMRQYALAINDILDKELSQLGLFD